MNTVPTPGAPRAERRVAPVIATQSLGRRRRPSGEPPPLPRRIDYRTRWDLLLLALASALWVALSLRPALGLITRADLTVLRAVATVRSVPLTRAMLGINAVTSSWTVRLIAWGTIATLVAFRRFRHLAVYLVVFLAVAVLDAAVSLQIGRMRPAAIPILGPWQGYAQPSRPVVMLALVLAGAVYALVPEGRWRTRGKLAAAAVLGVVCAARLYLAVDHPTDLVAALILGWVLTVVAFRLRCPLRSSWSPTVAGNGPTWMSAAAAARRSSVPWIISLSRRGQRGAVRPGRIRWLDAATVADTWPRPWQGS